MKNNDAIDKFIIELNNQPIDDFNIPLLDKLGENNMQNICIQVLKDGDFQSRNNLTAFIFQSNLNLQKELR